MYDSAAGMTQKPYCPKRLRACPDVERQRAQAMQADGSSMSDGDWPGLTPRGRLLADAGCARCWTTGSAREVRRRTSA